MFWVVDPQLAQEEVAGAVPPPHALASRAGCCEG